VVCATNRKLEREIQLGHFRQDLLYRINVVTIHLPPLRERREDVAPLAEYFLRQLNAESQPGFDANK
jgi:DNA-binding NtrC family response regulator